VSFTKYLQQAALVYGFRLSDMQIKAFDRYYQILLEWNQKMNLTAITDPWEVAVKHMVDSLSCYKAEFFPQGCSLIDVGTGAGFPGIPLKIIRPDIRLTLLDSLQKRVDFLQAAVDYLGLSEVTAIHARAEEGARLKEHREQYQVAVARAVARLNVLCELCLPFVAVGGVFIALKGAQYQEEIAEAQRAIGLLGGEIVLTEPIKLPGLADKRAVVYIQKLTATAAAYPRRPGIPEKKPL